jgi:sugar lactone lactonase YvrE
MSTALKTLLLCSLLAAAAAAPAPATGWPTLVETVTLFDPLALENPESVVIDQHGNRYISLALTGEIRKVAANGAQSTVAVLPLGPPLSECGNFVAIMGALAFDAQEKHLFATVNSCLPGKRGVWRVRVSDGAMSLVAPVPANALINGITRVGNTLYFADSELGLIWHAPVSGGPAQVWFQDPLLAPDPTIFGPGPNGLQYFRGELYVCVSDPQTIVAVKRKLNGQPGAARVHANLPFGCDDFAFDVLGNIWATTDPANRLLKVRPDGSSEVVLDAGDLLDGPTAAAFGRHGLDRLRLYIANAAFPFFTTTNRPSLMRLWVGIPGANP